MLILVLLFLFLMFIAGVCVGVILASGSITKSTKGYQPTKSSGSGKPPRRV